MLNTKETVTFLGDVYLPESFSVNINFVNYVANLESPVTKYDVGIPGKINLKVDDNHIMSTFRSKPLALCLANNHICDYGETGFNDTIAILENEGISYFGAGGVSNNCNNPLIVNVSGISIGLLAYVCETTSPIFVNEERQGVELIAIEKIKNDIRSARGKGAKKVIVSFHWGAEHVSRPKLEDVKIARSVVDLGADLVIGHHAHCIQSWEKYKEKYIFYGLGNCIFPDFSTNAYYDKETNKPDRKYSYKQKYWNKASLAVDFNPITDEVLLYKLRFSGNVLKMKSLVKLDKGSIYISNYNNVFKRSYALGKLRSVFFNWLYNPKVPKLRHVKGIIQVLTNKKYK
jgi:poly-gamma-glutamate synthesis protein (capsule biosynthesis protein)